MRPAIGSRWTRPDYDPAKGTYNAYTVLFATNEAHQSDKHEPQVVYQGDNGHRWSLALNLWPGSLVKEENRYKQFAEIVGGDCGVESEHDGQILVHCYYCGVDLNEEEHSKDCLHLKAIQLLDAEENEDDFN